MGRKPVAFKESRWGGLVFLYFLFAALSSVMPEENVLLLVINLAVATVLSLVTLIIWKVYQNDSKRYFSLSSYIMLMSSAYFWCTPIFRQLVGTIYFWLVIALLFVIILPTHLFKDRLLKFIKQPYKYGLFGKFFLIFGIIVAYFASYVWIISIAAYNQVNNLGMLGSLAVFGIAVIFLFLAPIMLNKQEDVERIEKSVNS